MIIVYLKIRITQLLRAVASVGVFRILVLLALVAVFGSVVYNLIQNPDYTWYLAVGFILPIIIWQYSRSDKVFMQTTFKYYYAFWFAEYTLILLPVLVLYLSLGYVVPALLMLAKVALIVVVPINRIHAISLNTPLQKSIKPLVFEWKSGLRTTLFVFVFIWLMALGLSFVVWIVPVFTIVLLIISFSFYETGEPWQFITALEVNSTRFLVHKIKMQVFHISVVLLPLLILFIIFHSSLWYITLILFFIIVILSIYVILTKYAFYTPNEKSGAAQVFFSIGLISAMVPFLLPLVFLLSIRFYFKAKAKLNFYLYDYS